MGPLGKVAAYRWLSSSDDGGSGATPGLVVVLLVFVGIAAALLAFEATVTVISSTVYATLRPLLIRAPTAGSLLGGLLLASVVLAIGPYSEATARTLLTGNDPGSSDRVIAGKTHGFFLRNLATIGFVAGYVALGVPVGNDLVAVLDGVLPEQLLLFPLVMALSMIALFYALLQIVRLPYRYHRLLRRAPWGGAASITVLLPVTATAVGESFDLPFIGVENHAVGVAFLLAPYLGGLVLVKLLAEPHILGAAPKTRASRPGRATESESEGATDRASSTGNTARRQPGRSGSED